MVTLQCDVHVSKSLQWLRGRRELCDVVVVGGNGHHTSAHSCVLAAHSTVIAALLQGRLAAQRDWSVLRPLVISVGDGTTTTTTATTTTTTRQPITEQGEDVTEGNVMEVLVALLYGEAVNVPPALLHPLLQHAQLLGLSHHICSSLQTSWGAVDRTGGATGTSSSPRRKHTRKPALKNAETSVGSEKMDGVSCVDVTMPAQVDSVFSEAPLDRGEAEGGILEFSMLCGGVDREINTPQPQPWPTEHSRDAITTTEGKEHGHSIAQETGDATGQVLGLVITAGEQDTAGGLYCAAGEPKQQEAQQKQKQRQRIIGKGLVCEVCGTSFQRCGDLIKHVQHSQHFSQQCPLCFVQVRDVEGQRLHFALHDQELPFFCVYCDLRFRTRAALTMHAPKHSTSKPFICGDCGRGFKWRHALQAHSYTHSATSRLLCDVCGFSSKYVTSFKAHLLQHSGSSFHCPHPGCSFSSSRKTHLNDHYATHSKSRVHQCEVCGYSFSHAKNMRRHMRLHAPSSNLLLCSAVSKLQCSFQTTRLDKLRDHLAKKHSLDHPTANTNTIAPSKPVHGAGLGCKEEVQGAAVEVHDRLGVEGACVVGGAEDERKDGEGEAAMVVMADGQQDDFSVLVVSPEIVELADIHGLGDAHTHITAHMDTGAHGQTHTGDASKEGRKRQIQDSNITEITDDTFPSDFLVNHELLLDKTDVAEGGEAGGIPPLPADLLGGKIEAVESGTSEITYQPAPCNYCGPDESVVMEAEEEEEEEQVVEDGDREVEEMEEEEEEEEEEGRKSEREKQCMDSLNILEFMLDNVGN